MDVGHFKRARKQAGLTQQRAAAKLRVCQSYLSMVENGQRALSPELARRMVHVYKLSPVSFPPSAARWDPKTVDPEQLAADLAGLGYPGFAYLRKRRSTRNPGETLAYRPGSRPFGVAPLRGSPVAGAQALGDGHGMARKGGQAPRSAESPRCRSFGLARNAGSRASLPNPQRDAALEQLESTLKRSLLAREEGLGAANLAIHETEEKWLKEHRPKEARGLRSSH